MLWKCRVVPAAEVTAWRVLEDKLVTKVNLEKRGIRVVSSVCIFCGAEEESCSHLFFKCRFVWLLWNLCSAWLGVQSVFHNVPLLNFSQFRICNATALVNEVWEAIWIAVVNEIWKHRNKVIFDGGVINVLEVFALVQLKAGLGLLPSCRMRFFHSLLGVLTLWPVWRCCLEFLLGVKGSVVGFSCWCLSSGF